MWIRSLVLSSTIITAEATPRAGVFDIGSWAIGNLVFASLAFLSFVFMAAIILLRNLRYQGSETGDDEGVDRLARRIMFYGKVLPWMVVSTIAAMLVIFLFAFSQDFRGTMLVFDKWSFWLAILYLLQVMMMVPILRMGNDQARSNDNTSRELKLSDSDADYQRQMMQHQRSSGRISLRSGPAGQLEDDSDG
ncbi:MAG: hypothetical protein FWD45_05105 [Coriobacteriia bacterium]|nr:hypothetical protein [Coriobacteriia bacterium]